ncbi:MAG: circadian clock protein KaiC [Gammaproteobacteria bacterium]|nr:circadian clock protein KaiC [Gammaproteobacteria bacterium]
MPKKTKKTKAPVMLQKCLTGITGLDEITFGGLPKYRSTLVSGGAGSGKTMLGMEFLIRGAALYKEPGLFVAFEETQEELTQNIGSLGFNIKELIKNHLLVIDHIQINRSEFAETGSYNLDGLFIRLGCAIAQYKIKRVVLDTLEILFSNIANELMLRSELQRLFRWFKEKKITVLVTAEKGQNAISRYGLEEYVADCVILLDNRMDDQVSTRRLRIAKYRGSSHGANEYPFIINEGGFTVTAITSITLNYKASTKRISSGLKQLDTMLDGKGFYEGSSILISGPAGIGKSSFAATFAYNSCKEGKKAYYFAFEESVEQIVRNMKSIGIHLEPLIKKDLLRFHAINPNSAGLEAHMHDIQKLVNEFNPSVVIIDPVTNLKTIGNINQVQDVLALLVSYFKSKKITVMFTSLVTEQKGIEYTKTNEGISSSMDVWIYLQYINSDGERNRAISILKSRGMAHSNQLREIIISKNGVRLEEVYVGTEKVLTGSARLIQATKLEIENSDKESDIKYKERQIQIRHKKLEAEIAALHEMLEGAKDEITSLNQQKERTYNLIAESRAKISKIRMADSTKPKSEKNKSGK